MSDAQQSWATLMWRFKWWWMLPMGLIAALFVLLVWSADATGDAPFVYTLF